MTDYDAMTNQELRAYILRHRDDVDAIEAFFARRSPGSEAVIFPPAKTEEEWHQQVETLRPILERGREQL
ncbi:MAG: hypothetical protein HC840_18835 [Leptolyngbyaceae cyanobacterium RM2_2_4]|nr:hypothetical protein [Leptolyngbyaceae cyanobacterium RM2_2_4]